MASGSRAGTMPLPRAFVLTGPAATTTADRAITATPAVFTLTGAAASFAFQNAALGLAAALAAGVLLAAVFALLVVTLRADAIVARRDGNRVGADLVRDVAIGGNPIAADDNGVHLSFLHHVTGHIIGDQCGWNFFLFEFPGGQSGAL